MQKTFEEDFNKFKNKLLTNENFSFLRFSDGELFILQNKRLELNPDHYIIGNQIGYGQYNKEERKKFLPEKHQKYRDALLDSLSYKRNNYYKGISCSCCVGLPDFFFQVDLSREGVAGEHLSWSNVFINSNYQRFVNEIIPILKTKKTIFVVNESAKLENLGFNIIKDFRVGENCFINNFDITKDISNYIENNNIKDHCFLISAASLSNVIIHKLSENHPENTYIDIGSTLNPLLGMVGWRGSRQYLLEFWENKNHNFLNKKCIWYNLSLVSNEAKYWPYIYQCRFDPANIHGFITKDTPVMEDHNKYMKEYGNKYKICLLNGVTPVGFIGMIDSDIRLAVSPSEHGRGVGSFMLRQFVKDTPEERHTAKVFKDNNSSNYLFSSVGFTKLPIIMDDLFYHYEYENN